MSGLPLDVRFSVPGVPVSKGSMSGFPIARGKCAECKPGKPCRGRSCFGGTIVGVTVTDQGGKELEAWQEHVFVQALSARNVSGMRAIARPAACEVTMVFVMPRPAGHWTASGSLTAEGRAKPLPSVKPDLDKMQRAVLDGLSRALVEDDAQVCVAHLYETYAPWKGWTGVDVRARMVSELDHVAMELLASLGHAGVSASPQQRLV